LQDGLDLLLDDGRKFRFTDLNHVEGSLRLVWELLTIILKNFHIFFRISTLAFLGIVESDCELNDLVD